MKATAAAVQSDRSTDRSWFLTEVQSQTGSIDKDTGEPMVYEIRKDKNTGRFSCACGAWRNKVHQERWRRPDPDERWCKHLEDLARRPKTDPTNLYNLTPEDAVTRVPIAALFQAAQVSGGGLRPRRVVVPQPLRPPTVVPVQADPLAKTLIDALGIVAIRLNWPEAKRVADYLREKGAVVAPVPKVVPVPDEEFRVVRRRIILS